MSSWHSYPKVWALGHSAIKELFLDPVHVEEKIDGSQFSFGMIDGILRARSKGMEIDITNPEKMFLDALGTVNMIAKLLTPEWTYRTEYLQKPKHNILHYSRAPKDFLIGFDINTGQESYLSYEQKRAEFERIGLECVPKLFEGKIEDVEAIKNLLETESCLGGQKVEGLVFKNYLRFGMDKKALLGKFVSERFKEQHKLEWRQENPLQNDIIRLLQLKFSTEMRWDKSVQHLRERGELQSSPKDIGALIKEVREDAKTEIVDEVKNDLFAWAWPQIERALVRGLPEWYKEKLAASQFDNTKSEV